MVQASRRGLLTGHLGGDLPAIRPPWSIAEADFADTCSRCDDCLRVCPEGILVRGSGGFPEVSFAAGGCTFCGRCLSACESGALVPRARPWSLRLTVGGACLGAAGVECRVCADWCEVRAIRFDAGARPGLPQVDAGRCTRCGACVAPCPTGAITLETEEQRCHV